MAGPKYDLTVNSVRTIIDRLRGDVASKEALLASVVETKKRAQEDGDVAHLLGLNESIARLEGEIEGYRWSIASIETRTRVGMEKIDSRI